MPDMRAIVELVARNTKAISERRLQTRERLISAASEVVAKDGYPSATVDNIAEHAGLSIGALYSNFDGKDDLFFAVFDEHIVWFEGMIETTLSADDPAGEIAAWIGSLSESPQQFMVFIEFWAYAVRKPKVRRKFAARMARVRSAIASAIERRAAETDGDVPLAPELIALLALALGRGLALEKLADADAVPDDVVGQLLAGLVPGA